MEEQDLLRQLKDTPFACSSLARLSGGSANYVYRGILIDVIPTRDESWNVEGVIVKYSLGHIPGNAGFKLDLSRCSVENIVLEYLNQSSLVTMKVKIPVTYFLDLNAHRGIAVQQDFRHSTDIASIIRSTELSSLWMRSKALSTSQEVGHWLHCFHEWASEPQQADFRGKIGCNEPMQRLKHKVTYGAFIEILNNFPDILQRNIRVLEKVKERAELELLDLTSGKDRPHRRMIHGDCWMGNVLLSKYAPAPIGRDTATDIVFIDWEMCQFGHRAYDLGHMIGDLYEAYHFHSSDIALTMIRGFMDGYGKIDDDMAFRTAIHAGVQFLGWYNRRAPSDTVKGTEEQISSAAKISTNFIVKGWERERQWFQGTPLAPLFKPGE
ncbi:kinase-like domain-containing protein [Fusarium sp. MPI-SDFR-AT-0072]|nr:kinase-like domain-containing protein [Fusarium sp. MPI-SDFR-AT-0072]